MKRLILLVCCLAMVSFMSCGSDDDSTTVQYDNSRLNGTHFMGFFGEDTSSDTMWGQIDDILFDGNGAWDLDIVYDSTGSTGSYSDTYSVISNGEMNINGSDIIGIASSDGNTTSFTDAAPAGTDDSISLGISVEKSSGMSVSNLNGDYVFCQIRYDDSDARPHTARFAFSFDGSGAVTGSFLEDSDGGIGALAGTYTVAADGAFGLVLGGVAKTFQGHVSQDGNFIVVLDNDTDGEVLLMAGLKETSSADNSLLSGSYQINLFGGDDTNNKVSRMNATFDGSGNLTATIIADSAGDTGTHTLTYTIAATGRLVFTDTGQGIVSSDGSMFLVVDTYIVGGGDRYVMMMIGNKKS